MQYLLTQEEIDELKSSNTERTYEGELYKTILSSEKVQIRQDMTLGIPDEFLILSIRATALPSELVARIKLRPDVRV